MTDGVLADEDCAMRNSTAIDHPISTVSEMAPESGCGAFSLRLDLRRRIASRCARGGAFRGSLALLGHVASSREDKKDL